jgi:hypothetical protein
VLAAPASLSQQARSCRKRSILGMITCGCGRRGPRCANAALSLRILFVLPALAGRRDNMHQSWRGADTSRHSRSEVVLEFVIGAFCGETASEIVIPAGDPSENARCTRQHRTAMDPPNPDLLRRGVPAGTLSQLRVHAGQRRELRWVARPFSWSAAGCAIACCDVAGLAGLVIVAGAGAGAGAGAARDAGVVRTARGCGWARGRDPASLLGHRHESRFGWDSSRIGVRRQAGQPGRTLCVCGTG